MLSQIHFVPNGINANGQVWNLGRDLGHGFEAHILQVLTRALDPLFDQGVKIYPTPASRDDGKDVVIESPVDLDDLMGFSFPLRGKEKIRIYIECKSSNSSAPITYNQIAGNVARIKNDAADYYVLVTNTTIAPYSYYQFHEELEKQGITFFLLDQFLLSRYLKEWDAEIGRYPKFLEPLPFQIAYQWLSSFQDGQPIYKLYLLLRNYTGSVSTLQLQVNTDRNWNLSQQAVKQVLPPYSAHCVELLVKKEYYDGVDELLLSLVVEGQEVFTEIKGLNWESNFIPPLCGRHHQAIIDALVKSVQSADCFQFFYVWGEAGVGKTRVIDELLTRTQGRNVDAAVFRCVKNGTPLLKKIKDYLVKKEFLLPSAEADSITDLFTQVDTHFRRLLLVIDDLHNADISFLDEITRAAELTLHRPITLLTVGRNDYSEGSLEYYALVQQSLDMYHDRGWVLEALDEEDAKQFIRLIVQDIPEFALNKIYSLSNRIPLFIVETIEYLLDLKLVRIMNRSSVGVQNPESFNSRLDIPEKIEEIYTKRLESLSLLPNGEQLKDFLMACSLVGIGVPYETAASFFESPEEDARELFQRRFLQHGSNGEWQYVHESLYLFLKKRVSGTPSLRKRCSDLILGTPQVFQSLRTLQKGRVCLWSGDADEAAAYFHPALQAISKIQNHSNINIDRNYYEYLEDMYECVSTPELQEKVILCKIYIALHYHTPYIAIQQCQWARKKLSKSKGLKARKDLDWMLKEHEAHCYLNAGQLKRAELLLQDLLAATVYDPECVDPQTLFDLYDKLSNLHIKYNNKETALKYIRLAEKTAKQTKDSGLQALAYITHGKLNFFRDQRQTRTFTEKAETCLAAAGTERIRLHNEITKAMLSTMDSPGDIHALEELAREARSILDVCMRNQYANSVVRADLLLGVLSFLMGADTGDMEPARRYLKKGIDASLQFGIGTYMWQFYNLLAMISIHQKDSPGHQARLFETVYQQLRRQGLLYIGSPGLCYGNLLAISNIAGFYALHHFESEFYQKMSAISYMASQDICDYNCGKRECGYVCAQSTEQLRKELKRFQRALAGGNRLPLPFQKVPTSYPLWDGKSGCYIILG